MYTHIGTREAFKFYREETKHPVTQDEYRDISAGFNKFLIDKVIAGETVKFPERIGSLRVTGRKVKPRINKENGNVEGLSPDWKETKALWKRCPKCKEEKQLVFHFNENTDGLRYSFKWSKTGVFVDNRDFYSLKMARSVKNKFKEVLNAGKEYLNE